MVKVGRLEKKYDEVKVKQFGKDGFSFGRDNVDLSFVEPLLDFEQTTTLSYCLKALVDKLEKAPQDIEALVEQLDKQIKRDGLASLCKGSYLPATLAGVRKQEIYACVNRYRGLI